MFLSSTPNINVLGREKKEIFLVFMENIPPLLKKLKPKSVGRVAITHGAPYIVCIAIPVFCEDLLV
jgi:hypothetical protein